MSTTYKQPHFEVTKLFAATDARERFPEGATTTGGRTRIAVVAAAIKDIRDNLSDQDCAFASKAMKHKLMALGRDFANDIGVEPYGGMAVFGDPDEGILELVCDSIGAKRRVTFAINSDLQVRTTWVDEHNVVMTGWQSRAYSRAPLAKMLVGR